MKQTSQYPLQMDADGVMNFLKEVFVEQWHAIGFEIISLTPGYLCIRLQPSIIHQRPGGTLSGPTMFTLADVGAYALVNAHTGPRPLSVTTNLNINFMRKPDLAPMIANLNLLKLGKRLAVVNIEMANESAPDNLVAQATATYALQQV